MCVINVCLGGHFLHQSFSGPGVPWDEDRYRNSHEPLLCMASGRTLPAVLPQSRGKSVAGGNAHAVTLAFRPPRPSTLTSHSCAPALMFPLPLKSVFPFFSLGWVTAGAFRVTVELASFPVLFFLPRVAVQRVVHPDILPWLSPLS